MKHVSPDEKVLHQAVHCANHDPRNMFILGMMEVVSIKARRNTLNMATESGDEASA